MNKYQEALDYLVGELKCCDEAISDFEYQQELNAKREATEKLLQELVDKTTPKKPDYWGDWYGDEYWNCPCCEKTYEVDYDESDYCPNCGQAIDWSE